LVKAGNSVLLETLLDTSLDLGRVKLKILRIIANVDTRIILGPFLILKLEY